MTAGLGEAVWEEAEEEVSAAVRSAEKSPFPEGGTALENVFTGVDSCTCEWTCLTTGMPPGPCPVHYG